MERGAEKGGPARRRETADLEVAPIRRLFQEQNDSPAPSGGLACTRPSQEEGGRSWGSEAPVADCRRLFLGPGARGPTPSCARVAPPGMRRRGRWRLGAIWKAPRLLSDCPRAGCFALAEAAARDRCGAGWRGAPRG